MQKPLIVKLVKTRPNYHFPRATEAEWINPRRFRALSSQTAKTGVCLHVKLVCQSSKAERFYYLAKPLHPENLLSCLTRKVQGQSEFHAQSRWDKNMFRSKIGRSEFAEFSRRRRELCGFAVNGEVGMVYPFIRSPSSIKAFNANLAFSKDRRRRALKTLVIAFIRTQAS